MTATLKKKSNLVKVLTSKQNNFSSENKYCKYIKECFVTKKQPEYDDPLNLKINRAFIGIKVQKVQRCS